MRIKPEAFAEAHEAAAAQRRVDPPVTDLSKYYREVSSRGAVVAVRESLRDLRQVGGGFDARDGFVRGLAIV